jgi:hypothetical protein
VKFPSLKFCVCPTIPFTVQEGGKFSLYFTEGRVVKHIKGLLPSDIIEMWEDGSFVADPKMEDLRIHSALFTYQSGSDLEFHLFSKVDTYATLKCCGDDDVKYIQLFSSQNVVLYEAKYVRKYEFYEALIEKIDLKESGSDYSSSDEFANAVANSASNIFQSVFKILGMNPHKITAIFAFDSSSISSMQLCSIRAVYV